MVEQPGRDPGTGWSALRPVLVAFLLAADAFAVGALVIVRPDGWVPPTIGFGTALVGLVWLEAWAIGHRHDHD